MYRLHTFKLSVIFLFSCILGALFALIWRKYLLAVHISAVMKNYGLISLISHYNTHDNEYLNWLQSHGLDREPYGTKWSESLLRCDKDLLDPGESMTEACRLREFVPIVCIVLTSSATIENAKAIRETWGTHCNKIITFVPDESAKPWAIGARVNDFPGIKLTWSMLCQALFYSYVEFESQHSWFFVVHDETFAIPENLRYLLAIYNASKPYYFGHSYRKGEDIYNTLQGGIVLSRETLKRLHENASLYNSCSKQKLQKGDLVLSQHLKTIDIIASDTRDFAGRGLFNLFEPEMHLIPGAINWFHTEHFYKSLHLSLDGAECCSDYAITFHAQNNNQIRVLYYLVYKLVPYGLTSHSAPKQQTSYSSIKKQNKAQTTIIKNPKQLSNRTEASIHRSMPEYIITNEIPDSKLPASLPDDSSSNQSVFLQDGVSDEDESLINNRNNNELGFKSNEIKNVFTPNDEMQKL